MVTSVPAPQFDRLVAVVMIHEENDGVGEIVDIKKLAQRRAGAPDDDLILARLLRFVELADERRQHMARRKVEIVVLPIKVAGHDRNVAAPELFSIRLTELDPGDFCDRIPFVGRLERAGQKRVFLDRLRREFRIDAGGAKKDQPIDAGQMRSVYNICRDDEIVIQEIGRKRVYWRGCRPPWRPPKG